MQHDKNGLRGREDMLVFILFIMFILSNFPC